MSITNLKYTSSDETAIQVTLEDGGSYTAPWPCYTWHSAEIQAAIDAGLQIEQYKTYSELEEERKITRKQEIISILNDIDVQSVRPLRAKASGTATAFEEEKLILLDRQASELRAEILSL